MMNKAKNLVAGVSTLVSLPSVYMRLTKVINQRTSSARDIGKIVSEDPGLTARLLRLVNSAYYGFPQQIETVTRAISVIGTHQLVDLALATSVIEIFKKIPHEIVDMESFWKHSLACGIFARVLAEQRRETNIEQFFVAGLLHDIGKVIIYLKNGNQARQVLDQCRNSGELVHDVERQLMGYNHAEVGHALLENWNLPTNLREAVLYQYNPKLAGKFTIEATIVHVSDIITTGLQLGSSGEILVPPLVSEAWNALKIATNILPYILDEGERQYNEINEFMLQ